MKKALLTSFGIVLFSLSSLAVRAQNFQPFRKGPTYHFVAQDSIYSLRVDSVKVVGGDSVFVFNPIARKGGAASGPTCTASPLAPAIYAVHANNQFGRQMRKTSGGDYIFKTVQGQEYLLKTKVAIGQTWVFNTATNISATLTAKGVEPVATVSDSVYTYTLSNGKVLKLSKSYGFITTPNFITYTDSYFKPKDLTFYALPEKGIGHTLSSPFAIFDYQVGDQLAYYIKNETGPMGSNLCLEEWIRIKVLSRQNSPNGDSILYVMEERILKKGYGMAGSPWCSEPTATTLYPANTYTVLITKNDFPTFKGLSNAFYNVRNPIYGNGEVVTGIFKNAQFNQREQIRTSQFNYDSCATAFLPMVDLNRVQINGRGIGLVYSRRFSNSGTETIILEAYIKGSETYGTWVSLGQLMASKEALNPKPLVKAFPNPFTSELTLTFGETSGKTQLSLRNTLGQVVWEKEITATPNAEMKVNLPELAKGLYVLQATQNGKVYTSRIVKE